MNENDTISRKWLLEQYDAQHEGPPGKARKLIEEAPALPHEMSAREFVATISDMCINQFPGGCAPCPLWVAGHGCGEKILPPEEAVAIVEEWAREHPEEENDE